MRPYAEHRLQMLGVHQQAGEFVFVHLQPEQHAQPHIVNAALHGAIHRLGVVVVVVLGSGGVQLQIALLVISFLEQDVGADARFFQLAVIFHRGGGNVDIHPANVTVFVVHAVNGMDAVENVVNRVVYRVLARLDRQPLVPHVLQCDNLGTHLVLGQLFTRNVLVFHVIGTVDAAVDAVIGQIQRRKNDNAVTVKCQLDLLGDAVNLLHLVRQIARQQHRCFAVGQPGAMIAGGGFAGARFLQNLVDQRLVVFVRLGVGEGFLYFCIVDKFGRDARMGIVHMISSLLRLGFGINGFDADAVDLSQLAGQRANDLVFRIDHHADDANAAVAVGNAHPSHNVGTVAVQQRVDRFGCGGIFHNNTDQSNACFHK